MTSLLIKLFVKDRENVTDPDVRKRYAMLASITGIILNVLLFASKLTVGWIIASIAIIADAFNNISDASSSVVTFIGFRMSGKRADKDHPLGHGRFEYIAAFIVDMLIIFVGVELFKTSVEKIIESFSSSTPAVADDGGDTTALVTFILLGVAILIKLWMFFFYRKIAKKINSAAIRAASFDSISDVVATALVLVSAVISRYTNVNIDGWAGIAVACFILFTGIKAAKETIDLLLGQSPSKEFVKGIYDFVENYPEVIGIHDVMVHDYGPGRQIISFHAEVPSDSDFNYAHDVVDCIERDMGNKFGCIVTIHLDPIVVNDERVNEMKKLAEDAAAEVNPGFAIHDFRMTSGGKHVNMIFDLCIPMDCKMKGDEAAQKVAAKIAEKNPDCYAVIKPEHPFV